jgi:DNA-binding NtrC family response regulator
MKAARIVVGSRRLIEYAFEPVRQARKNLRRCRTRASRLRVRQLTSRNAAVLPLSQLAALAAKSDPCAILGRTGTGKTRSRRQSTPLARAGQPFVPSTPLPWRHAAQRTRSRTSCLHRAQRAHKGKFEIADKGTLFFDEIADMSPLAQAKILRAIEYGEFERVGGEQMHRSNARIISATNCSLRERIRDGKFREDLYHRLDGLVLLIPALHNRAEDLPSLIAVELKAAAAEAGKSITSIHPTAMDMLLRYEWPGNLRELRHTMRSVALFCEGKVVLPEHVVFQRDLAPETPPPAEAAEPLRAPAERAHQATDLSLGVAIREHVRRV